MKMKKFAISTSKRCWDWKLYQTTITCCMYLWLVAIVYSKYLVSCLRSIAQTCGWIGCVHVLQFDDVKVSDGAGFSATLMFLIKFLKEISQRNLITIWQWLEIQSCHIIVMAESPLYRTISHIRLWILSALLGILIGKNITYNIICADRRHWTFYVARSRNCSDICYKPRLRMYLTVFIFTWQNLQLLSTSISNYRLFRMLWCNVNTTYEVKSLNSTLKCVKIKEKWAKRFFF